MDFCDMIYFPFASFVLPEFLENQVQFSTRVSHAKGILSQI